jgi:hypothetical protein
VGVEGQAIFGEEGTGAFLLHGIAVEGGGCDGSRGLNHGDGSKVFQSSGSGVVSYGGKEVAIVDNVRSGSGFFADNVGGVGSLFGGVRGLFGDVVLGGRLLVSVGMGGLWAWGVLRGGVGEDRGVGLGSRGGKLVALEDAAHAFDIAAQALAALVVVVVGRHYLGREEEKWTARGWWSGCANMDPREWSLGLRQ